MRRLHVYHIQLENGKLVGPFTSALIARRELSTRMLSGVVVARKIFKAEKPKATS